LFQTPITICLHGHQGDQMRLWINGPKCDNLFVKINWYVDSKGAQMWVSFVIFKQTAQTIAQW
jgi:hypothetical protein